MAAMTTSGTTPLLGSSDPQVIAKEFRLAVEMHAQGQLERALLHFERVLAHDPRHLNAINGSVAVLLELQRPNAAYQLMGENMDLFARDTDSLCNWAIVCESVGKRDQANQVYEQVLLIQPNHLRALNNSALNALAVHDWATAISRLKCCCELEPNEPALRVNLIDALSASHDSDQALKLCTEGIERWPDDPDLELRHAMHLAFNGHISTATVAIQSLRPAATARLKDYLSRINEAAARLGRASANTLPDAQELYFAHQFSALQFCDWRDHERLCRSLKQAITASYTEARGRDWRDLQFYALMLPLTEELQSQAVRHTFRAITSRAQGTPKPAHPNAPAPDGKLRVGIALQSLHDPRHRNAMETWIEYADHSRFAYHLYANTPSPFAALSEKLRSKCTLVEINHLSVADTIERMRLDRLDVYLDAAFYTPWCRAEIPYGKVSPINVRLQSWQRWNSGVYQYVMGDRITHPDDLDRNHWGPTVRLPHTSWLALNQDQPMERVDRHSLGLPSSALVFAAFNAPTGIEPTSFECWMKLLKMLPDAVIWFPQFDAGTRSNLLREAKERGVAASRIQFDVKLPAQAPSFATSKESGEYHRAFSLAQLQAADFFLDSLCFGSSYTLCDALRLGLPSATVCGNNLAKRLGASILTAAGHEDAVHSSTDDYLNWIVEWAKGGELANSVRARNGKIHSNPASVPLFDVAARVQSWENAMLAMASRSRQGLPPQAFDI